VVITDFGLAVKLRATDSTETATATLSQGSLVGTPSYMAPEQVEGGEVGAAADLYAMGIVAFEMVTGALPFRGETSLATAVKRLSGDPPAPRSIAPEVDPRWDASIRRAMAREPGRRFPSAMAFVEALEGKRRVEERRTAHAATIVLGSAAALALLAWGARNVEIRRSPVAPARAPTPIVVRKVIAVLPFGNAAERTDAAWLSTALAEMLTTELGEGGAFRAVPGETVVRATREMGLSESGALENATLAKFRRMTGADLVASGAYTALGGDAGAIRVDLRLQDAASGELVATFAETGSEAGLFDLVTRAGKRLREALGAADLTASETRAVRASVPVDPAAARLYSEGLEKLRLYDAVAARDLFERAIAIEPDHAVVHGALAEAWTRLGYDAKAAAQAERAVELSPGLPRETRLLLEAQYAASRNDHAKAVEGYGALFALYPDDVDHGLELIQAQFLAGKNDDAVQTLSRLRALPPPADEDPRLDIAEARIRLARGESALAIEAAERGVRRAAGTGSALLEAGARSVEASSLLEQGRPDDARAAAIEAERAFERAGDRSGAARAIIVRARAANNAGDLKESVALYERALEKVRAIGDRKNEAAILDQLASCYYEAGNLAAARMRYERAIAILREVDARGALASSLGNLANVLDNEGSLDEALALHRQATDLFRESGNRGGVARSHHNVALVLAEKGDLDGAQRNLEEALVTKRELGHRRSVAFSLHSLGDVLVARDDLVGARERYDEAFSIREALGEKATAAATKLALAQIDIEEGRCEEAARTAAEQAEFFRRESMPDSGAGAESVRATALVCLKRLPEAVAAAAAATSLASKTPARPIVLNAAIAAARVDGAAGRKAEALRALDVARDDAARFGLVGFELEARLARAELDPSDRAALVRDATSRGYLLIARKGSALK
jgi:tetratricopeptide (TPR) repeat protein/TolB-like protein